MEQKNRVHQMQTIQAEALELFKKKNSDYGDAFATYGTIGILIRINEKVQRAMSIKNNGISLLTNESLRDTLIDLHNYSAMSLILLDE